MPEALIGAGPLAGIRVLELGGIGPGPHAAMLLADLGADVVRVERPDAVLRVGTDDQRDQMLRSRRSVTLDTKDPADLALLLGLVDATDVLIEGFRPGAAERMGIGPDECLERNPGLVYGRITGWGQDGPLAKTAGHDINYVARTGALGAIGERGAAPSVPLNLVGDFGGGSLYLVVGVLAALLERERSGLGQVVDAAMVDGTASLLQLTWALRGVGQWRDRRGSNLLDGAAPFYTTYVCTDGGYVAVGALEPAFFAALCAGLGWDDVPGRDDPREWPALRARLAEAFAQRTRDEWATIFDGTDACVSPVLELHEVASDHHLAARATMIEVDGVVQAAPAPRFSRTSTATPRPPRRSGADTAEVLAEWLPAASMPAESMPVEFSPIPNTPTGALA